MSRREECGIPCLGTLTEAKPKTETPDSRRNPAFACLGWSAVGRVGGAMKPSPHYHTTDHAGNLQKSSGEVNPNWN